MKKFLVLLLVLAGIYHFQGSNLSESIKADYQQVDIQQTILASLQVHFSFPDYFGGNLDAAFDLLLDVVDTLNQPTIWQFCTGKNANTDNDALASWQQLMQDVIDYASGKGVMLQVELFVEP
ncbi:barstar family protein [Rheinheimera baltica]|uniref:barstar family protein n=1 Tax=Rheinheimera baltica TaxID=67576 RepID=UPI00274009C9|nr:barstar family protein [Rheinheimera baltica]MDP5189528.1 barstar family protein [Rheinheimera baltica]